MMDSEQQLNCVFCKDTFEDKETLQIHFRKHADPTFKKPNNKCKSPQSEPETSKETPNTASEIVTCDVCPEVFPTISKAITHKHKVHPDHDTKHFCEWCGKLFTLKHLYSKHLVNHQTMEKTGDEVFHCDCCNVDFNVPSAMIYHNKFFHRQDMELPAIGHSKRQKFVNKELVSVYYCAFCGEEFINKVNLHKHMADDHGDENQSPDEILRCPLCEAIFYHLDAYEIHLTFHTVDDIYCTNDNENKSDISEFTLDSVPPLIEKVEDYEPEEQKNAINIEQLLQLSAETNNDPDSTERIKHKKHKKHKKSKKEKSAITLDQFLNMNSDVFGEGLDFQGAEEIPTQVVKKQLKIKSKPQVISGAQAISRKDLDKLKQQGIVVKMKSTNNIPVNIEKKNFLGTKVMSATSTKIGKDAIVSQANILPGSKIALKDSNDKILSKLMNQTHSQIKIVKKPAVGPSAANEAPQSKTISKNAFLSDKISNPESMRSGTPENIEVECDLFEPSSEIDTEDNESGPSVQKTDQIVASLEQLNNPNDEESKLNNEDQKQKADLEKNKSSNGTDNLQAQEANTVKSDSMSVLKNINPNLSIKSFKPNLLQLNDQADLNKVKYEKCRDDDDNFNENSASDFEEVCAQTSSFSETSPTFRDLNKSDNITTFSTSQTVAQQDGDSNNENDESNKKTDENTKLNLQCDKQTSVKSDATLNILKKLGISVKSMSQPVKTLDNDNINETEDPKPKESIMKNEMPACVKTGNTLNVLKNLGITVKSNHQSVKKDNDIDKNCAQIQDSSSKYSESDQQHHGNTENSLNVLKKIGITVKSRNQSNQNDHFDDSKDEKEGDKTLSNVSNIQQKVVKEDKMGKSLNALKNLGIVIKSSKQDEGPDNSDDNTSLPHMDDEESDLDEEVNDAINVKANNKGIYSMSREHKSESVMKCTNLSNKVINFKQSHTAQTTSSTVEHVSNNFQREVINNDIHENKIRKIGNVMIKPKVPEGIKVTPPSHSPKTVTQNKVGEAVFNSETNEASVKTDNALKNLTQNITVKSIGGPKSSLNKNIVAKEPEIFSIDDSDDEEESELLTEVRNSVNFNRAEEAIQKILPVKPVTNTFRNLEGNRQQDDEKPQMSMVKYDNYSTDDEDSDQINISSDKSMNPGVAKLMNNKNISFKNRPNLNKVEVRSGNNSPKYKVKELKNGSGQKKTINSFDDFFSNESSDDDEPLQNPKHLNMSNKCKDFTQESNSDDDFENDDSLNNVNQSMIDKLKNFNHNLTIRSNKSNETVSQIPSNVDKESTLNRETRNLKRVSSDLNADVNNPIEESSGKPFKQSKFSEDVVNAPMSKNKSIARQAIGRPLNHAAVMNQQISATNTVNQEVTTSVKTIQTKTTVEEITTTVTRTIKTVNQEVLSKNKTISNFPTTSTAPNIVQGMRMGNQKIQGFPVRQPNIVHRPRTRPMIPTRPSMNTAIRSSNPVSFRPPGFHQVRPSVPRMPTVRNVTPRKPGPGKVVRVAPNVIQQQKKIINTEPEPEGHFSCFKKPKECLIPDPMSTKESTIHVASSSQMTKSNFNSSTKTVKGKSTMTATKMKSEVHTSSQQMSRLGNVSGLSVMKSIQTKQAVKEVNQCVVSGAKRTTLEAIEKLQKLGLSVKKPRVEEPEDSDQSEVDDDDDRDDSLLAIESGE